ncbi:MAG: hypothetical protein JWN56_2490 [Sphingobacteriales bacterium]|nr:hypothetical protein [Sphingobacteriales bacterium]
MVALLYLAINYNRVKARLDKANELNLAAIPDPEKVESLKNKYRQKTNEELVEILNYHRFVMEAKIASKELMEQRRKESA